MLRGVHNDPSEAVAQDERDVPQRNNHPVPQREKNNLPTAVKVKTSSQGLLVVNDNAPVEMAAGLRSPALTDPIHINVARVKAASRSRRSSEELDMVCLQWLKPSCVMYHAARRASHGLG